MVLNHTRISMPFSNPFPEEALHLDLLLVVGEVDPLLPLTIHHGMHRRHPPDLAMVGAEVVVGGVGNRWVRQPHGMGEGVAVPLLGLNRPPRRLLLSKQGEVPQPP